MYFYYLNETKMLTHSIHYTTGNGKKQSLYRKFRIASDGRGSLSDQRNGSAAGNNFVRAHRL